MKKYFANKLAIAIVFFLAGAIFMWGAERILGRTKVKAEFVQSDREEDLFGDDLFGDDPFQDMRRMQKQMRKFMAGGAFADLSQNDIQQIQQREDEQYVYIEIDFGSQIPKEFNVQVESGMVTLAGKVEAKDAQSFVSSSFHRSLPVPANVDAEKFQMEQVDHKIVIKFPKTNVLKKSRTWE